MRRADVPSSAWLLNLAAGIVGLLLFAIVRRIPYPSKLPTQLLLAAAGIVALLLSFASSGADGVHRWLSFGGLRLHAAAIVTPLIILAVSEIAFLKFSVAAAIAALTTTLLALQPDAAQATSFAAACGTALMFDFRRRRAHVGASVVVLLALAVSSLVKRDPLLPVAHVEGILALVADGSAARGVLGVVALVLLPLPFFEVFRRRGDHFSIAFGVYVALISLSPFWGTFPVPIMGYGVSPIIGYFTALAFCVRTNDIVTNSAVPLVSA
jgi:cell division protein FtsW (lipid II flippase)